jgi:hypothetical protein
MLTTFFEIGTSSVSAIIGYGADLIGNFMPVLVIFIAIAIGIFIIRAIMSMK